MTRQGEARQSVLVVGGGFSGVLTALHLLFDQTGPQVRLVERRGVFGRGLAYSTQHAEHLLNVRAANMSAFPDQLDHFTSWLAEHRGSGAGPFVTRRVYGEYLQSMLRAAVDGRFGVDRLLLEVDEVVDLAPLDGRWRAQTSMGRELWSDAVVLATGVAPTPPPPGASSELLASGLYVGDPWRRPIIDDELGSDVLLLGTGLTMVDVALMLERPGRRFTAISRRGLTPHAHGEAPPTARRAPLEGSPVEALAELRRRSRAGDWREVIDHARESASALWRSWSLVQRRQFLRHARPWWDTHRHRMAPPVAARIREMQQRGDLVVAAGATQRLELDGTQVKVEWRPRGSRRTQVARFDAVVNCTGQGGDIGRGDPPLLGVLLRRGLIRPDPCSLGVDVDALSRPLAQGGHASEGLFAVGPITRGGEWEITSVPDIRRQAQDVAGRVREGLRGDREPAKA